MDYKYGILEWVQVFVESTILKKHTNTSAGACAQKTKDSGRSFK